MSTELRLSRRAFVTRAGGAAGIAVVGGAALGLDLLSGGGSSSSGPANFLSFHSAPRLHPPGAVVAGKFGPGLVFLGPGSKDNAQPGPMIVDGAGQLVWFRPLGHGQWATNFKVQSYHGRSVLTWWEGKVSKIGYGRGIGVIADHSYREIARIQGVNGRVADMHELLLTAEGTALFTCYPQRVHTDLSVIGGPKSFPVLESVIQEVDIASGRLIREWRSLDHISVAESYRPVSPGYDYLHANSIDVLPDGNLLVSARNTWTVYKLDRRTGAVIWRLGGKRSHFKLGHGVRFTWQHDARLVGNHRITLFDDGFDGRAKSEAQSRALAIDVDFTDRTATLAHAYKHPDSSLSASSMGSVQTLPNGDVLVGWGSEPYVTQFTPDGRVRADLQMPPQQQSYRAYHQHWDGLPAARPHIAVDSGRLYASWNGATRLAGWRLLRGAERLTLKPAGSIARRTGFETSISLGSGGGYVAVAALDAHGRELGRSAAVKL
jgi:hypothetical protein